MSRIESLWNNPNASLELFENKHANELFDAYRTWYSMQNEKLILKNNTCYWFVNPATTKMDEIWKQVIKPSDYVIDYLCDSGVFGPTESKKIIEKIKQLLHVHARARTRVHIMYGYTGSQSTDSKTRLVSRDGNDCLTSVVNETSTEGLCATGLLVQQSANALEEWKCTAPTSGMVHNILVCINETDRKTTCFGDDRLFHRHAFHVWVFNGGMQSAAELFTALKNGATANCFIVERLSGDLFFNTSQFIQCIQESLNITKELSIEFRTSVLEKYMKERLPWDTSRPDHGTKAALWKDVQDILFDKDPSLWYIIQSRVTVEIL